VDVIAFCPHDDEHSCDCRKPQPGMYQQIAERMGIDLARAIVIGDSRRDLEAAIAVNARAMLVRTGKGKQTETDMADLDADIDVYDDLAHAVSALLIEE
jgi:D-glycero-D-manno-heptose 1,7-bisphosphate phosphatase